MSRCLRLTRMPAAARVRETGGVAGKNVDRSAIEEYLRAVDLPRAIAGVRDEARKIGGLRGSYLEGLALCLETMWDLAIEVLGKGEQVPYARCVEASTGRPPEASQAGERSVIAWPSCWAARGTLTSSSGGRFSRRSTPGGKSAWFRWHRSVRLGAAVIAHFDQLSAKNLMPYLPQELLRGAAGEY